MCDGLQRPDRVVQSSAKLGARQVGGSEIQGEPIPEILESPARQRAVRRPAKAEPSRRFLAGALTVERNVLSLRGAPSGLTSP